MSTPTSALMGGVINHNRGVLMYARELNRRAGSQVFPVMDRGSLAVWLANRLQGARCGSEVANLDALKLPELDATEVARVLAECPDTLVVLGSELPVEYREGSAPLVRLTESMVSENRWNDLPDVGITTPGGRPVEIKITISYYTVIGETAVPRLKARMREHRNEASWNGWQRPELPLPDLTDEATALPEIREAVYGQCVVTGVELTAYGVIRYNSGRWSNDPYFVGDWTRDRLEAEKRHAETMVRFEELRKEIREKARVEAAKADAESAKAELWSLQSIEGWYDLEHDLRRRVEDRQYAYLPSGLEELTTWTTETRAIKAEVEAIFAETAERKRLVAEAERKLAGTLPEGLVEVFGGDTARAVSFWAKARKLDLGALDDHIVYNCGRARVRDHLVEVSGDSDFFCGADPNRVGWFIGRLMAGDYDKSTPPASDPPKPAGPTIEVGGLNLTGLFGGGAVVRGKKN